MLLARLYRGGQLQVRNDTRQVRSRWYGREYTGTISRRPGTKDLFLSSGFTLAALQPYSLDVLMS
jgi:hypothetical protein